MRNWIPLARVAREHGLTKGEISYLRCDLLQVGGLAFEFVKQVAFSESLENSPTQFVDMLEPIKPLGGKWGQAKAVIVPIPKTKKWSRGECVWVSREMFPKISDQEIYLCDLMGVGVSQSSQNAAEYFVCGIEDRSKGSKESISLILESKTQTKVFEIPLKSVDWTESTKDLLVVPSLQEWSELA